MEGDDNTINVINSIFNHLRLSAMYVRVESTLEDVETALMALRTG